RRRIRGAVLLPAAGFVPGDLQGRLPAVAGSPQHAGALRGERSTWNQGRDPDRRAVADRPHGAGRAAAVRAGAGCSPDGLPDPRLLMRVGSYSHLVRIEQDTGTTKTAIGEEIRSWVLYRLVWAA